MERCPVEVWQRILSLACTDGGYTGCSLSLVSRFMRDAVEPICFHSVMLIGRERCTAFATLLDRSTTQKTIRHLFVHWQISPSDPGFPGERRCYQNTYIHPQSRMADPRDIIPPRHRILQRNSLQPAIPRPQRPRCSHLIFVRP